MFGREFGTGDLAQQVLGGMFVAGPFVVTEEVWTLAAELVLWQVAASVLIVLGIGYFSLYGADEGRDPENERRTLGVPHRYVALISVSYLSVFLLSVVVGAPSTFGGGWAVVVRACAIGGVFSVIGASTADSLF